MVGHLLHSAYGCDIGKKSLLHRASICLRLSPGQFNFCLFQLCLFNEATVPGFETISGTYNLNVCCVFACSCTVLTV